MVACIFLACGELKFALMSSLTLLWQKHCNQGSWGGNPQTSRSRWHREAELSGSSFASNRIPERVYFTVMKQSRGRLALRTLPSWQLWGELSLARFSLTPPTKMQPGSCRRSEVIFRAPCMRPSSGHVCTLAGRRSPLRFWDLGGAVLLSCLQGSEDTRSSLCSCALTAFPLAGSELRAGKNRAQVRCLVSDSFQNWMVCGWLWAARFSRAKEQNQPPV